MSTQYAAKLTNVVEEIVASESEKYESFDLAYTEFPMRQVFAEWKERGGELWQLIELVDGLHTNQLASELTANQYWKILLEKHPNWIGI